MISNVLGHYLTPLTNHLSALAKNEHNTGGLVPQINKSALNSHLKEKNHSVEDNNVNILAREHRRQLLFAGYA